MADKLPPHCPFCNRDKNPDYDHTEYCPMLIKDPNLREAAIMKWQVGWFLGITGKLTTALALEGVTRLGVGIGVQAKQDLNNLD